MGRIFTIRRIVGLVVGTLFFAFGIHSLIHGFRKAEKVEQWKIAKPMEGPIDFSTPGEFTFPFHQTSSAACQQSVTLNISEQIHPTLSVSRLLAGLIAELEITNLQGSNVLQATALETIPEFFTNQPVTIFGIRSFPTGFYNAKITVLEGAPALKGVNQRVEAGYLLCGLEEMPAIIGKIVGSLSTGLGSLIGGITLFFMVRARKQLPVNLPQTS